MKSKSVAKKKPAPKGYETLPVEKDAQELLKELPEPKRQLILSLVQSRWESPLPPPQILRGYETVVPGSAERILAKFEQQAEHRMALEKVAVAEQLKQSARGQLFALIISISGLACSLVMAMTAHEKPAMIIGGATLVALVSAFLSARKISWHRAVFM